MFCMSPVVQKEVGDAQWFEAKDDRGNTVGFAIASKNGNKAVLDYIHTSYPRRRGWGSMLLQAIFGWARQNNSTELTGDFIPEYRGGKDEAAARAFYAKQGVEIGPDGRIYKKL